VGVRVGKLRGVPVRLYELGAVAEDRLEYVVIVATCGDQLVMVRHRHRDTWETPGGHIEPGEPVEDAAKRELIEETGAVNFSLVPVCEYSLTYSGRESYARLYRCSVEELGPGPSLEIAEVRLFDRMPSELTYPDIHPRLMARAMAAL